MPRVISLVCAALACGVVPSAHARRPVLDNAVRAEPAPLMSRPRPHRPPPPPPVGPRPIPAVVTLGKQLAGTYRCKGVVLRTDGSSQPLRGKLTIAVALGGSWLQETFAAEGGISFEAYRTYDAVARQWTRVQLTSTSGHTVGTTLGERGGVWTWSGSQVAPSGTLAVRDFERRDGRALKRWGDAMLSGTWQKVYEVTCAR